MQGFGWKYDNSDNYDRSAMPLATKRTQEMTMSESGAVQSFLQRKGKIMALRRTAYGNNS
jgi:hypothetical protein